MMDKQDERIQRDANRVLDESVRQLDAETVYRLQLARGKALQDSASRSTKRQRLIPIAAASVVAAFFVGFVLMQQPIKEQIGLGAGKDHRISVEGPDEDALYEDLDFYIWLSSKEWPS